MTPGWKPLRPWGSGVLPPGVDPYLVMAEATDYADHGAVPPADEAPIAVSLQMPDDTPPTLAGLRLHAGHSGSRFRTGTATRAALQSLVHGQGEAGMPLHVLLAAPCMPQRPPWPWTALGPRPVPDPAPPAAASGAGDGPSAPEVLLAVIDSGCPFAHRDLRRGAAGTRVVRLWDQGSGAHWSGLGQPPDGFDYGHELTGSELARLMAQSTAAGGAAVDEAECYRRAGYGPVLGRASHGAHTLGTLAGPRRWNTRREIGSPEELLAADAAAQADIVFVQLGHELTRCISVAAVENRALDALRYVLQQAREWKARRAFADKAYPRVVVSFGYESWIGPHDGRSWFEAALDALITSARHEFDFRVHMIAGNARDQHVHIAAEPDVKSLDFDIVVQPGNETATWVEVWTPPSLTDLKFTLQPPNGSSLETLGWGRAVVWPDTDRPQACVVTSRMPPNGPGSRMLLLRIAPTLVFDSRQAAAPHGRWHVSLRSERHFLQGVHAYLSRSDEGGAAQSRARQSHFAERATTAQRELDKTGTLNGHACGEFAVVSGAYYRSRFPDARLQDAASSDRVARYSGTGPTRGNKRADADDLLAVDDGLYAFGVLAMGNTSATVFRMDGTSVAAPMRARMAAKEPETPLPGKQHPPAAPVGHAHLDPFEALDTEARPPDR